MRTITTSVQVGAFVAASVLLDSSCAGTDSRNVSFYEASVSIDYPTDQVRTFTEAVTWAPPWGPYSGGDAVIEVSVAGTADHPQRYAQQFPVRVDGAAWVAEYESDGANGKKFRITGRGERSEEVIRGEIKVFHLWKPQPEQLSQTLRFEGRRAASPSR